MFNKLLHATFAVGVVLSLSPHLSAAILYESGTLGPTGVTWSDLSSGAVPGINITGSVFNGVRFELTVSVITTEVGGHFASPMNGTFFGAIVELSGENDFPNSSDLSTSDVLGAAVLNFPGSSAEVYGDLALTLDPGWYALIFGGGLFGTAGSGGAVGNNPDIGVPAYIGWQPGAGWFNLTGLSTEFGDYRFIVEGSIVPEPSAIVISVAAILLSSIRRF
jgi:hypothetical protein